MITRSLKIKIWDKEIGILSWDERRSIGYFEYDKQFLKGDWDIFPIIASIHSPASRRPIIGEKEPLIYRHLPPFLADSLPDAWGNQVFECWRIENNIQDKEITPLDVLSFIGQRGMGALEFEPETSNIKKTESLNLQSLIDLAERIFVEREKVKVQPNESLTLRSLMSVGTSAGGRQPKAIIAIHPTTGEIRSGQIAGQEGFEYYILKFGDAERTTAEVEMAYYEMAVNAGIQMMPCRLMDIEGKRHFLTKRFDRQGEKKLHLQTLAALYPEADSYEKLMMVCRKLRLSESAQKEIFRRMVFNILANNTDDHNKNFSFLMDEEGRWSLSPAYDQTFIFDSRGFLPDTTHCLLIRGKFSNHTKEDALAIAKENGIPNADDIIQEVGSALSQFSEIARKYNVKQSVADTIASTIKAHLDAWGLDLINTPNLTFDIEDVHYSNVHIETTYKGNFHLLANRNGEERKFVIGKNKPEFSLIAELGVDGLSEDQMKAIVRKYLHQK